ncbi:MAG: DUF2334 domain-containing protein [Firmicutes bacterium]|nr:DUF2334 domain-containing protein [Bacillota bacterium]
MYSSKKLFISFFIVSLFFASVIMNVWGANYIPYTAPEVKYDYREDNINFIDQQGNKKVLSVVYCNGRIFVPFYDTLSFLTMSYTQEEGGYNVYYLKGKTFISSSTGESNKTDMCFYKDKGYVSLYKILEPFGLVPVYDLEKYSITILKNTNTNTKDEMTVTKGDKKAYIRLEDVVADGLDTSLRPNYTIENIEKLRYTAQYLCARGQQYYVAFIPVYVNGKTGFTNDVTKNFGMYNSYFIYVLDYMSEHNGHIGAHGYTHQYGQDISGVGYEWGENTPYNATEQQQRMIKARQTVEKLGYKCEFFEFPHYGATMEQINMAQYYFDVLYQPYWDAKYANNFTYTARTGKKVYFMPTPADYVYNKYDMKNILKRMTESVNNKYTLSLFFHPVVDKDVIYTRTENGTRRWNFSSHGILPAIVNYAESCGYKFAKMF